MEKSTVSMSFSITGDFLTNIAREWFWIENKPWSTVEELLLSCMLGTDQTKEELIDLARKVVYGQAKFVGHSGDGTFGLVEEDKDLVSEYVDKMAKKLRETEEELEDVRSRYLQLCDYLIDNGRGYLIRQAGVGDDEYGGPPEISPMLESYMKRSALNQQGIDNDYGWLEPDGTFHPVEWAEHQEWAAKTIEERGWLNHFAVADVGWVGVSGDFLVFEKGWVLLHNPARGVARVSSRGDHNLTKAQREFLFEYYAVRGEDDLAMKYWEE